MLNSECIVCGNFFPLDDVIYIDEPIKYRSDLIFFFFFCIDVLFHGKKYYSQRVKAVNRNVIMRRRKDGK